MFIIIISLSLNPLNDPCPEWNLLINDPPLLIIQSNLSIPPSPVIRGRDKSKLQCSPRNGPSRTKLICVISRLIVVLVSLHLTNREMVLPSSKTVCHALFTTCIVKQITTLSSTSLLVLSNGLIWRYVLRPIVLFGVFNVTTAVDVPLLRQRCCLLLIWVLQR